MEKIISEGKEYTLTQEAYIDGPAGEDPVFRAAAVDSDGNDFLVEWNIRENWKEIAETGDNTEMCDWDTPASVDRA